MTSQLVAAHTVILPVLGRSSPIGPVSGVAMPAKKVSEAGNSTHFSIVTDRSTDGLLSTSERVLNSPALVIPDISVMPVITTVLNIGSVLLISILHSLYLVCQSLSVLVGTGNLYLKIAPRIYKKVT